MSEMMHQPEYPPISILLSDVSRMKCDLLSSQLARLEPRLRVVGQAITVDELLAAARTCPDVALISSALRDGPLSGFEALAKLQTARPETNKVMVFDRCEQELVIAAFRGGARGVFCRSGCLDELVKCIGLVQQGQIWAGNLELGFILNALSRIAPLRIPEEKTLNRREAQIAALVATGANDREIGRKLNMSESTATDLVLRLCTKFGVQSRVELAMAMSCKPRVIGASAESTM